MKLIKHDDVTLQAVKMLCDEPLHSKLDNTELTKSFFNRTNFTLILGSPGSGKTTWTLSFIRQIYKKIFDKVLVVMPESSRASLAINPFEKLPESQVFEDLTAESAGTIYEMLKEHSSQGHKTLLILDDVQHSLKRKEVLQSFKKIVANRRHLRCSIFLICQNYTALDKSLRLLVNNIICFNVGNIQFSKIHEEHLTMHKEMLDDIRRFAFTKSHDSIMIHPDSERIFKGFDEIEYK